MRDDMTNIYSAEVVAHVDNQAIGISTNLEDRAPRPDEIDAGKVTPDAYSPPVCLATNDANPIAKLPVRVRMFASKRCKPRPRDHVYLQESPRSPASLFPIWEPSRKSTFLLWKTVLVRYGSLILYTPEESNCRP